ncbi:S8 family peptidase [Leptolyngbya sp. NIES-2104]|uniref:S8 family peptidase n=1 Tax=Leptolyngbya sp. NIES-2104 TaxID=1552121 RepID=UPI0006EC8F01|nr:S8 family serine peptidase [Leptolyngbya sp. NIES-2104]GAP95205.1 subtilisin [Leptolyngbya sp. NIES-2104]
MKTKHIVLRNLNATTRDFFAGPGSLESAQSAPPTLQVAVDDIERKDISSLNRDPDVVAIAPVMPMNLIRPVALENVELEGTTVENAASLTASTQTAPKLTWGVQAVGADTSPFTGEGIVVSVLDSGIDATHPAFAGVEIVQKDFTGEGDGDKDGHGTHCAGTIFGRAVEDTRIGVAPGVSKALIGKVIGEQGGSSDQIADAILWAFENGANVISMSLGIDFPGFVQFFVGRGLPIELATSRALEGYRANVQLFQSLAALANARTAFAQPTVLVAAAGNESRRQTNKDWEIAVAPPAVSEGIISVAALGRGEKGYTIAPFSNTGANLSGPGVQVLSAKAGGGLVALNGTSMAAPHVSGVAALWAQKLKQSGRLTALELTARVIGNSTPDGIAAEFDPFDIGAGMVRAPQS